MYDTLGLKAEVFLTILVFVDINIGNKLAI